MPSIAFAYSRRTNLIGLLVAGVLHIMFHVFAIARTGFIYSYFFGFSFLIFCYVVLWFLRGTTLLVTSFPQFHFSSLIVEFGAHSVEAAYLTGSISWSFSLFDLPAAGPC